MHVIGLFGCPSCDLGWNAASLQHKPNVHNVWKGDRKCAHKRSTVSAACKYCCHLLQDVIQWMNWSAPSTSLPCVHWQAAQHARPCCIWHFCEPVGLWLSKNTWPTCLFALREWFWNFSNDATRETYYFHSDECWKEYLKNNLDLSVALHCSGYF